MSRIHLVSDRAEIERRRGLADRSIPIEVWQDLYAGDIFWIGDDEARRLAYSREGSRAPTGLFWMGAQSKAALDRVGEPLLSLLTVSAEAVPIYYGSHRLHDDSLPCEESLRARVLSGHGIAVACTTYKPDGQRHEYEPRAPTDPTFYLRRPRAPVVHLWRLFRERRDAIAYATEHLTADPDARRWADDLPAEDFEGLLARFSERA